MAVFTGVMLGPAFAAVSKKPLVIFLALGNMTASLALVFTQARLVGNNRPY
jgi:hypothetical protein